jgi:hypothetical protein
MADNDNPTGNTGVVGPRLKPGTQMGEPKFVGETKPIGRPAASSPIVDITDRDGEDVTYIPSPGDAGIARWRGIQFEAGVPLAIRNKWHLDQAKGNRNFVVGALSDDDKKRLDDWRKQNQKGA